MRKIAKLVTIFSACFLSFKIIAQIENPGNDPDHPPVPFNLPPPGSDPDALPINSYVFILLILGLIYTFFKIKRSQIKKN